MLVHDGVDAVRAGLQRLVPVQRGPRGKRMEHETMVSTCPRAARWRARAGC
ncbi:MAG: hypothetical protein ACLSHG_07155 [Oscillospiraceae bacterium]